MSTHNICFYGELMKIILRLSWNTLLYSVPLATVLTKPFFSDFYISISLTYYIIYRSLIKTLQRFGIHANHPVRDEGLNSLALGRPELVQGQGWLHNLWGLLGCDVCHGPVFKNDCLKAICNQRNKYIWAMSWENLSLGVSDQVGVKLAYSATKAS